MNLASFTYLFLCFSTIVQLPQQTIHDNVVVNQASQTKLVKFTQPSKQQRSSRLKAILKSAKNGDSHAQYKLGSAFLDGKGVKQNNTKAGYWFSQAAKQGNPDAQYKLAKLYRDGKGVEVDLEKSFLLYRKAAEQNNSYAQCQGVAADDEKAVHWYQKAAANGHATAQYNLGQAYRFGNGVEIDLEKAFKLIRKAAAQNDSSAQCLLGWMYGDGEGVAKDPEKAVAWYHKSAANGYAMAQYNLGQTYRRGGIKLAAFMPEGKEFQRTKTRPISGSLKGQLKGMSVVRINLATGTKTELDSKRIAKRRWHGIEREPRRATRMLNAILVDVISTAEVLKKICKNPFIGTIRLRPKAMPMRKTDSVTPTILAPE